ncbi:DUF6310 domain-containing protein [Archangium primigenium]|nr:DUF6310 domain-containing protein [Archangium primigenium]
MGHGLGACGYQLVVGIRHASHREALLKEDATLKVVVTGC